MNNAPRAGARCALLALAVFLSGCAATPKATDEAAQAVAGRSEAASRARDLALAARQVGDTEALGEMLVQWREAAPHDEQAWSVTLQHALRTQQPDLLREAMQTWLGLRSQSHARWEDLAIAVRDYWGEPMLVAGVEQAMQALALRDSVLDNLYRSELAEALGLFDQAVRSAQHAVDMLESDEVPQARQVRTLRWHARLMSDAGNSLAEIASLRRALAINPDAIEVRLQMAQRLAESGFLDEALALLSADTGGDSRAALMMGLMAAQDERSDIVAQALARLERGDGEQHLLHRAQLLAEIDRREQALDLLERLAEGPLGQRASLERARLLAVLERPDEARAALEPLLTADTDSLAARAWLMQAQLDGAPFSEQSFRVLSRGLAAVPSNPELLYARSLAAEQQGYLDTAERDLREVIELEPDNAHAFNALGYMLVLHTERLDEAEQLIDRALRLAPQEQAIIDSLGWLRFRQGRNVEALRLLRRAHEMAFNPEIAAHLAEVLLASGQQQAAQELLDEALARAPDNARLKTLAGQLP